MVISWTLPSFLPLKASLQLLGHCLQCWLRLISLSMNCFVTQLSISFGKLCFYMWCATWTGNSVAWCDKEWDAASWCDCIGKREEWYYGRRAEKKLVPCRDGATPYHIISCTQNNTIYHIYHIIYTITYHTIRHHTIPYHTHQPLWYTSNRTLSFVFIVC